MDHKNCGKQTNISTEFCEGCNRAPGLDPAQRGGGPEPEELFPILWILGFSIFSEVLLFAARDLGQNLLELIQEHLPEEFAPLFISYLTASLSALFPLLIFTAGVCFYAVKKKDWFSRPVKIAVIALFVCGHAAAAAFSDGLTAAFLLFAGGMLGLSGTDASVAAIILSLLCRAACETALIGWALRQVEKRL